MKLYIWGIISLLCIFFQSIHSITITLTKYDEECYYEQMDARTSTNRMLLRFGLVEPEQYDFLQTTVRAPSGRIMEQWNKTRTEYKAWTVRESGLYGFCYQKLPGSQSNLELYFVIDFISTGSRTLTSYPTTVGTIRKDKPDDFDHDELDVVRKEKTGVFDFDLHDISPGIIHDNTRVVVSLSVEYAAKKDQELQLVELPEHMWKNPSWNSMKAFAETGDEHDTVDYAEAETGEAIFFDVTDIISHYLTDKKDKIIFGLGSSMDTEVRIFSMMHSTPDHWPMLIFEDIGEDIMHELGYFREHLFSLRGEVEYIVHKERVSRDVVENTNSKVKWMSLFINLAAVGTFIGQVAYVRRLLRTGY